MAWARTWRPKRTETYPGGPLVLGNSEKRVALQLKGANVPFLYETRKVKYDVSRTHTYTPDFELTVQGNAMFIEVKGLFTSQDRVKHLHIQKLFPEVDLRFIFDNSNKKLSKTSKTTYAAWCEKHGFLYADKEIPKEWLY